MAVKPVEVVEIITKKKIYKEGQEATSIEVVNFKYSDGNECGYNLISQKNLYQIGDKAVFIQPDYCLSDIPLFESFIRPNGDEKKSKLGKNFRIRAVKFNFNFENDTTPIYSFGVLIPVQEVVDYAFSLPAEHKTDNKDIFAELLLENQNDVLQEVLGVIKYEEPETAGSGLTKGDLPPFLYSTDEENINNRINHVEKILASNEEIEGTGKRDGSSWTGYFKKDSDGQYVYGICSRKQEKKLEQEFVTKYKDSKGNVYHKYLNKDLNESGWYCDETKQYLSNEEVQNFETIAQEVKDSWVEVAKNGGYIEKLLAYCKERNVELAFRGELIGHGLKGSGNKNNSDSKLNQQIVLFGVDDLSSGYSTRLNESSPHNLKVVAALTGLPYAEPVISIKGGTYEELERECMKYFEQEQQNGRIVEGVVLRTRFSNNLSVKFMNPIYDSKK